MHVQLLMIGKFKNRDLAALVADYADRIRRFHPFRVVHLKESRYADETRAGDRIRAEEAERFKQEKKDMLLGMKVVKHVKSNAIVVVKDGMAKGIGTGQTNRIWATIHALEHAVDGTVLASDAFFPFRDCVDEAAKKGIRAIVQPGGSMRDTESIEACDEHGIAMVFTGIRHFKH